MQSERLSRWKMQRVLQRDHKGPTAADPPPIPAVGRALNSTISFLRKEVIQPQVPLRLPCYDFTPVADLTVVGCLLKGWRTAFG